MAAVLARSRVLCARAGAADCQLPPRLRRRRRERVGVAVTHTAAADSGPVQSHSSQHQPARPAHRGRPACPLAGDTLDAHRLPAACKRRVGRGRVKAMDAARRERTTTRGESHGVGARRQAGRAQRRPAGRRRALSRDSQVVAAGLHRARAALPDRDGRRLLELVRAPQPKPPNPSPNSNLNFHPCSSAGLRRAAPRPSTPTSRCTATRH